MDRRSFFKKSFLSLGAFLVLNAAGIVSSFAGVTLKASEGKLGYKTESKFPSKNCLNCKSYKARENEELGECVLISMRKQMKADVVLVDKGGHCTMWGKMT